MNKCAAEPFFFPGKQGNLFSLYHRPAPSTKKLGDVIFVPPFAEEMNCSRRMVTCLAERLNRQGIGLLVFDLYGTGESQGDFLDARWDIWLDDLARMGQWLQAQGSTKINLLGLRLGALLSLSCIEKKMIKVNKVILWNPLLDGKMAINQFLRLRVMASLTSGSDRQTTAMLRECFTQDKAVEVAGYELHPNLILAMDQQSVCLRADMPSVHWLEVVSDTNRLPAAVSKTKEHWRATAGQFVFEAVEGHPFWSIPASVLEETLLDQTVNAMVFS